MKWKILSKKSDDLTEQLLINRGIKEKEQFFNPKLADFGKELKLAGIEKAQKRILQAIKNNELIIIYGDYDVDGICASAILYKGLTSLGGKALPFIPHREKDGYGLSRTGLEFARDSGASLVVTVDNGIVAIDQAKYAKDIGLDLIITDHHLPLDKKPDAYAIVHSTKMCGAAVAWCLISELIKKELAHELLEFVGMATVCDLLPLIGLGRAFVFEGLKILNRTTNIGLLALINESGLRLGNISSYDIGHILGPRINAMGRLEHAIDSLRLVCTKDPNKARTLAKLLCETNITRQKLTLEAIEEARLLIKKDKKIHVLVSKKWSLGIIGLVAGKVMEEYARPAIAISIGEEISKGSARSVDGVNIVEVIREFSDILIDVGGHPKAAGFSLLSENVEIFRERLEKHALDLPDEVEQELSVDAEVKATDLTKSLVKELEKFEPFGLGNPRPIFVTKEVKISDIRTVGEGKHLKFKIVDPEQSRRIDGINAIAFSMGSLSEMLQNGQQIDLAYCIDIDDYDGTERLQLKVKDIKIT